MIWRWIEPITRYLAYAAGVITLFAMVLVTADVTGRYTLNHPITGTFELVSVLVPVLVFLGLACTEAGKNKVNIKVDLVANHLPRLQRDILVIISYLVGAAVLALLTQQTALDMVASLKSKEIAVGLIEFPVYPFKPVITLGLGLTSLVFLLCAVEKLQQTLHSRSKDGDKDR